MAFLDNLFGKKKKEFKAACTITKEPLEKGFGYLLTTGQIVTSKKYWDTKSELQTGFRKQNL